MPETDEESSTDFLRTEDIICLSCNTGGTDGERVCLAAEGFGNRMCFLQSMANKELPFDISVCGFLLEQALSVRALQEMMSSSKTESAGQSGHRTLLYGHAVLLRHSNSNMYLSCLSTQSSSSDKLAFDVGLKENSEGESCWWTIHPASKQRSEGEKVRVGDDLILVSVASERYLHIGAGSMVIASFQQTLWTVGPVSSGAVRIKSVGHVFGGDVLRLLHGDECLTIPPRDSDNVQGCVMYETGSVQYHARSLWKLEHARTKWAEGFIGWGQPCRLRHITSGRYLAVTEDHQVVTFHRGVATEDATAFLLRQSKDDRKFSEQREDEGMGTADIKYGDSYVYIQHCKTGLWLSYQTFETKKRGVGRVEEKKAVVMVEGHMDDSFTLSRAQEEENKSARVIRKCTSLISRFVKALESLRTEGRNSALWENISLAEVIKTLEDLIDYFAPPKDLEFEEKQLRLKALRNRQDLFQEEGMIALVLETIDHCSQWKSMRQLSHLIGEDSANRWNDMISYLYLLLAALINGNRANCTQFASAKRMDWLVRWLEGQQSSKGVLDVLHCVLVDSPEALNVIKENHIRTIISLIDKHGRDPKVLDVLCSLCVGSGVAVRSNQNLICENLLPGRDLLLQTRVMDYVWSMQPNIFVGRREESSMFTRWYYEAIIDQIEQVTHRPPHIRIGWANTEGFVPYPGGGEHWGCNGVGDDLFSYGFDGCNLWTAGRPRRIRQSDQGFQKGDIIGVYIDLSIPEISFHVNGIMVRGFFKDFNLEGMFYPVISMSAKVSVRFMLGGEHGRMQYGPPESHSAIYESLLPKERVKIEPCYQFGDLFKGVVMGLPEVRDLSMFVPKPVETENVQLPDYVDKITDKLAENIHELWAMGKIEMGWEYGERRDDQVRSHPCLTSFERLPPNERAYNMSLAQETLRTLLSLGYHISYDPQYTQNTRLKMLKLPNNYLQSNGFKPQPLDLANYKLTGQMQDLVQKLAENTHNVWAKERIRQGWTYGLNEDIVNKRSPHLVPYAKVDDAIKEANMDTASETVKTLMAYGYTLDAPAKDEQVSSTKETAEEKRLRILGPVRTYRGQLTYAVDHGKWYYEFEVITTGFMKVGWAKVSAEPGRELGLDGSSYAFEGFRGRKWSKGGESYGKKWQKGDVIGVMLDIHDKTISFSLNGELIMDHMGQEIAFKGIDTSVPFVPAFSIGSGQSARINFGQDCDSLKFFTTCGLQEGYEPFCVNMTRQMTLWYSKDLPIFENMSKEHPRLDATKIPGGSNSPPAIKVNSKTYGSLEEVCLEYVRLSLPVKCMNQFIPPSQKAGLTAMERKMNLENLKRDDDISKAISDKQATGSRSMSPFKLLKQKKAAKKEESRLPVASRKMHEPPPRFQVSSSEYSEESETESMGAAEIPVESQHGHARMKKNMTDISLSEMESESEAHELEAAIDYIDEYYYGVRIFPGQDPATIHVGWVTPGFHIAKKGFDVKGVRNVVVCTQDMDYQIKSSISRKNCYVVSAGELQTRYPQEEAKRGTPGLLIGCHIDTSTGVLSFTCNGKEVASKFQVEPGAMLFPAVFCEPTNKEVFQFELGRTKTALPLSAVLFRGGKHVTPQCPPRLDIQIMKPCYWARVPLNPVKVHVLKLSDIRGWSMLCEEAVHMMGIHIPEEDRCIDILELWEHQDLLKFHAQTLELYQAVCSHGNHRVAYELTKHVDEIQLMYCIRSKYMPGPLRMGFHNLLISLHLDAHAKARLQTQHEYIIPLDFDEGAVQLFHTGADDDPTAKMRETIPSLASSVSVRPSLQLDPEAQRAFLTSPHFPLDVLKRMMMQLLTEAVEKGGGHIRDPIGGSNQCLFVPLIRVVDNLQVMGLLDDKDMDHLLCLIDPVSFDAAYNRELEALTEEELAEVTNKKHGLLQIKLSEPVKLELCHLCHHLCDVQLRHRVEAIVGFCDNWVMDLQKDQKRRYIEIKAADLPPALAAKKTREFRCPPREQMGTLLAFRKEDLERESESKMPCACEDRLRGNLISFHTDLLTHCGHPGSSEEIGALEIEEVKQEQSLVGKLVSFILGGPDTAQEEAEEPKIDCIQKLISSTIISWAKQDFILDQTLIREMFSLLHRQYDGVGELVRALDKAYALGRSNRVDIIQLLESLGHVRALLSVQVSAEEEEILKTSIWNLADNKVFFQHPDLMRALGIHETVMQLMVNTLNKAQQQSAASDQDAKRRSSVISDQAEIDAQSSKDSAADMVVSCCRFLCYFCRTGGQNQRAVFEHLSYLLDNSCMLLSRPSLRGSCPLDVAYSSLMDNNELSLALRESDLDKVAIYLSRCGQQSNQELIAKGYPDIGWDPVEGERFLDFLRFCVWVNGESVEENANLVVRLLIRRPECLGPALRGEGGGLLRAMENGILMSEQIAACRDQDAYNFLMAVTSCEDDDRGDYLHQTKYDFQHLPPQDDEDYIDFGAAILDFYSSLVDLLGRCAPDASTIEAGRSDSIRARAILRSLVSLEDLMGVLGLRFILPVTKEETITKEDGTFEVTTVTPMPPGLLPIHKAAIVQFLERVYGIPDQRTFFFMLENGFLPDLRAGTTLNMMTAADSDVALALNRYLCGSVLPLLNNYCHYFQDADYATGLMDSLLHCVYKMSKMTSLTKNQRDTVSDFLVAFTSELRAPMMTSLLRKLVVDVPSLTENSIVALRVLTNHYERCGRYYGSGGWVGVGTATEEERKLTMMLFSGIFDSLAQRAYDPELFSKALPCLSAIGCALSPDYALSHRDNSFYREQALEADGPYVPKPLDVSRQKLTAQLNTTMVEFAEHYHDSWALNKLDLGWIYGNTYDVEKKTHPYLRPFKLLADKEKVRYIAPVEESIKAMMALGWQLELDSAGTAAKAQIKRKVSKLSMGDYSPRPAELRQVTLTREMQTLAEKLAENAHEVWASKKKDELTKIGGGIHPQLVQYAVLTDKERKADLDRALDFLKFMQTSGYRMHASKDQSKAHTRMQPHGGHEGGASEIERRFAYSLLEKLLEYVDKAAYNMKNMKPASRFSRRHSYATATEDVKFFGKVVLPLVERYFRAHRNYFITNPAFPLMSGLASLKEKEMTAALFAKLALLLRQRITAFGHDVQISVRCLQTLVMAIDAGAIVKGSPEIIRSSVLPFLSFAADDLSQTVANLKVGKFSHVKGTITRGATSLNYVHMVLLPVLTATFDHLGRNGFGGDLLVGEQQLCCYKILNALYTLGTSSATFVQRDSVMSELARHRPALGECVASFASTFPVAFLEPQLNMYNKNSILYGIPEDQIAAHSLEAKEVMDELAEALPPLEKIVAEIEGLAESGGNYTEAPHVIEVTLPMLCSYLPFWWGQGPDNVKDPEEGNNMTMVTADLMNNVLGNVLKLIRNNIGTEDAPWMNTIATRTQPIIVNSTPEMMKDHILPVADKLRENARMISKEEEHSHGRRRGDTPADSELMTLVTTLVRDMYAFYPLLIKYVDLHRSTWLKNPTADSEELYLCVAEMFNLWSKSHPFKKEEQNFVFANEIDNMALIMPSSDIAAGGAKKEDDISSEQRGKRKIKKLEPTASLNVAALKRLLPIGLNMFGGREQELVQQAKQKCIDNCEIDEMGHPIHKDGDGDIEDFLRASLEAEEKVDDDETYQWQKTLYKKIGSKDAKEYNIDRAVERVLAMAKVLQGLHWVEHPPASMLANWKKLVSTPRKRAVMACFRMMPLHNMPKHKAINLFLQAYRDQWLLREEPGYVTFVEDVTLSMAEHEQGSQSAGKEEEEEETPKPLGQLITAFSRSATTEDVEMLERDFLYITCANIMGQSCHGEEEEDEGEEAVEDAGANIQEQEMEKQRLLFEQGRLADRGAAEMVLMYISASKGKWNDMVISTIELGISILMGGNIDVQKRMINHLQEKRDVGFFTSVSGLMQQCSVLDLDAFERGNKAEGLGLGDGASTQVKNLHDAEYTIKLFRFLQLLCEGHNLEFQNYLRTQAGNTTTVNIIICTVDYLLRLQESIMDFYWNYSSKETIDPAGKQSFCRAISVAAQVFAAITEYIQGPCQGNQLALAHSRLWDAVGGFLYIFAHMQDKLSKDAEQLELLREFMNLQKDMMIMLLSMLEGNVMNGPIGKQMVDTLVESSQNFEMILKFFDIFLKMKDLTTGDAFMEIDANQDGIVSMREFKSALGAQKVYTEDEIDYIMMCVDSNQDGKVDFNEFTDRFHNPAKDIGFNVAVLLTNLSEHMPNDPRLERFLEKARSVLDYFEPFLGRIEIMGSAGKIERVYFEITQSHIDQWEAPQIKDSKRAFLHEAVGEEGDKEKLDAFTNFCEDTIFEMQLATSISAEETDFSLRSYAQAASGGGSEEGSGGVWDTVKMGCGAVKDGIWTALGWLHPSNIRTQINKLRAMTFKEMIVAFFMLNFNIVLAILTFLFTVFATIFRWILNMMSGEKEDVPRKTAAGAAAPSIVRGGAGGGGAVRKQEAPAPSVEEEKKQTFEAFGLDITREKGDGGQPKFTVTPHLDAGSSSPGSSMDTSDGSEYHSEGEPASSSEEGGSQANAAPSGKSALNGMGPAPSMTEPTTPPPQKEEPSRLFSDDVEDEEKDAAEEDDVSPHVSRFMDAGKWILCYFARNFYNMKLMALALAFSINFCLLFYKVYLPEGGDGDEGADAEAANGGNGNGEEELEEAPPTIDDDVYYLQPLIVSMAGLHAFLSIAILIAYYVLKVPLVIFKREKEICRSLEFEGMWISEHPSDDDIKGHWDKLVISTQSFPDKYWDKFVKKRVRERYAEQYDYDQISNLLGMEKGDRLIAEEKPDEGSSMFSWAKNIDWQYQCWKWGVIFTDNSFLYLSWYFAMSVLGNFNYFFFCNHLMDVTICFKTLGTILQSVTHNGKQLVLTVMLTSIVVYVYTVIAFNFFRKFYIQEEEGEEPDYKCHDMLTCFVFHLYAGVRAGGGIGDEIESPYGDESEVPRLLFDITFFFFVIIILLAIIQGLIIDAFGELRDQLEQVREDLESSCFICGIGKEYFDKQPHGFETHVKNEHNFANYMFFLMHLINKPETEYTGQETYVWELYQKRSWDFFPVGECFRKQYEDIEASAPKSQ